jgi:excisionase family DNA binding protein
VTTDLESSAVEPADPPGKKRQKKRRRKRKPVVPVEGASPYLSVEETAALLRTTKRAVYRLHDRGCLPGARKFGERLLVRRDLLLRSIEKSKGRVPASTDGETQA